MIIKYNEVGKFFILSINNIHIIFDEIEKDDYKVDLYNHNVFIASLYGSVLGEFIAQYNKTIKV